MTSNSKHNKNKRLLLARYRLVDAEMEKEIEEAMKGEVRYA